MTRPDCRETWSTRERETSALTWGSLYKALDGAKSFVLRGGYSLAYFRTR